MSAVRGEGPGPELDALAADLLQAWDRAACLPLPSSRAGGLTLAQAYGVAEQLRRLRVARGERPAGWKIGFTNRSLWERYGVFAPIWGPVWDGTVQSLDDGCGELSLAGLCQPRLEPEIVFGFARAPQPGMSLQALQECLQWVAHGFEVVHTHCADWRFRAADCVADFALHGRLCIGPRVPVAGWSTMADDLAAMQLTLRCDGAVKDRGTGGAVLDGPLQALKLWIDQMPRFSPSWQVQAGDVVTTGTITDAWPLQPGQHWRTELTESRLAPLSLHTRA